MSSYLNLPEHSDLGKKTEYDSTYNPDKLFSIPRKLKRDEIGIDDEKPPFFGFDCWNHYEVSWLNEKGKPIVAVACIKYSSNSPNIIESKSMKLYFNSFNNTKFSSSDHLKNVIKTDLQKKIESSVEVAITPLDKVEGSISKNFCGISIDNLDVECTVYQIEPSYLFVEEENVDEILCSDLLKSNCLVTNQPDWGSVQIRYKGKKINREGLLKYLISFRNHNEFHEQCIERIFVDILHRCNPISLSVHGKYTRRGGLDINPYRSTHEMIDIDDTRLYRQ